MKDICKLITVKVDNDEDYVKDYRFTVWYLGKDVFYEMRYSLYNEWSEIEEQGQESYQSLEEWQEAVKQATLESLSHIK